MTMDPEGNLKSIKKEAEASLAGINDSQSLENWRIKYIGRRGAVPMILREVKNLPLEKKRTVGQLGNKIRQQLEAAHNEIRQKISTPPTKASPTKSLPPTTPNLQPNQGHLHPLTLTARRIQKILSDMGFLLVEGPYVEEAKYNFDLLNIPFEHPARAETDTFYLKSGHVMRTHTSPVQLRSVLENDLVPPFRVFSTGRCFRNERTDATHESTFHQVEGLEIGPSVTIANFKYTIEALFTKFFSTQITTRLRPSFFPFVEPGFEVDMSCLFCQQKGCRICKKTGWLEIFGAGMVHPNVLRNMNIDPSKFQGYAFGGGYDRLTMLRHGIDDIRLFWSGDISFLRQFS
jgi:phenylalanyl-tRNA synthetase alpha chain